MYINLHWLYLIDYITLTISKLLYNIDYITWTISHNYNTLTQCIFWNCFVLYLRNESITDWLFKGARGVGGGKQKDKCIFQLYLYANSLTNSKGQKPAGHQSNSSAAVDGKEGGVQGVSTGVDMEFTTKDLYAVEEIHAAPNIFRLLIGYLR